MEALITIIGLAEVTALFPQLALASIPLLAKEGRRDSASPIGRSMKKKCAGWSLTLQVFGVSDHPRLRLRRSLPSFARRGLVQLVTDSGLTARAAEISRFSSEGRVYRRLES